MTKVAVLLMPTLWGICFFQNCNNTGSSNGGGHVGPPAGIPILETVYVSPLVQGGQGTVTSLTWPNVLRVQPALSTLVLRLRAPWPTTLQILINDTLLQQVQTDAAPPQNNDAGYFRIGNIQLMTGNDPPQQFVPTWAFWSVTVGLPTQFRFVNNQTNIPGFTLTVRDTNATYGILQRVANLVLNVAPWNGDACIGKNSPVTCGWNLQDPSAPSAEFSSGENNKEDSGGVDRMEFGTLAKNVTLAGWLTNLDPPTRQNVPYSPPESQDWHFSILLDNDFIKRNYVLANSAPLAGPDESIINIPGEPESDGCYPGISPVPVDCPVPIPLTSGAPPDAGTFMMPGNAYLEVELNAWHKSKRGNPPAGYWEDPSAAFSDNAWGLPVTVGTGVDPNSNDPQYRKKIHLLQVGDYVIVTGTLWEDLAHLKSDPLPLNACYNHVFNGQGGWLEIHPVDVVRYVYPPPLPHRHTELVAACATPSLQTAASTGHWVTPDDSPQDANSMLQFQEMVDPRFTNPGSVAQHEIQVDPCDPTTLDIFVSVNPQSNAPGYYKSLFLVWWTEGQSTRLPAITSCSLCSAVEAVSPDACNAACSAINQACLSQSPSAPPGSCGLQNQVCQSICSGNNSGTNITTCSGSSSPSPTRHVREPD